ncbi:MAG: hypothetical protein ACKO96_44080 [Flammeovirgaceae bacterium]
MFTYARDNSNYVGGWECDKKHGKGIFTWEDGTKFSGEWEEDESQGGILIEPDGSSRKITK